MLTGDGSPLAWSREGLGRGGSAPPIRVQGAAMAQIAGELWITEPDSYSKLALLLLGGCARAVAGSR